MLFGLFNSLVFVDLCNALKILNKDIYTVYYSQCSGFVIVNQSDPEL